MARFLVLTAAIFCTVARAQADIVSQNAAVPQVEASHGEVLRGGRTTIVLRGHYSGGSAVTFAIARLPQHGKLLEMQILPDNRAMIVYANDGSQTGLDTFGYVLQAGGKTSSPAEVTISIRAEPAKLQVPGQIDFPETMTGEKSLRSLSIANDGGGILAGRLTISSPWRIESATYRVPAGTTIQVPVEFWPNESKNFIGQISLTNEDGRTTIVDLAGRGLAPIQVSPERLEFGEKREATLRLTNETDRALQLNVRTSANLQQPGAVMLAPKETREVVLARNPSVSSDLNETFSIDGPGFSFPVQVTASAIAAKTARPVEAQPVLATLTPSAPEPTVPASNFEAQQTANELPAEAPSPTSLAFVKVDADRLAAKRWELRWSANPAAARYLVEERFMALDHQKALQIWWREIPQTQIAVAGKSVTAKIENLRSDQLHILRTTAFDHDGSTLWQSGPIALPAVPKSSAARSLWLWSLISALVVMIGWRWWTSRASA